ncbi:hypothetical protein SAMN05446635_7714 [Burkholderia sp. OK233]|nr:hypothetical protein SAMN05446635_7714 [Burkholderia sp. OK233]
MSVVREGAVVRPEQSNSAHQPLVARLKGIVGDKYVLTNDAATRRYRPPKKA